MAFMTPTRALMAVLVWLRASERISVRVLGIYCCIMRSLEAWHGVGAAYGKHGLGAHHVASHRMIAIRNVSASEIR